MWRWIRKIATDIKSARLIRPSFNWDSLNEPEKEKKGEGEDPSSVWLHRNSTYHVLSAGAQVTVLHHPKNVPLADNSLGARHWCFTQGYGCGRWVQIHPFGFIGGGMGRGPPLDSLLTPLLLQRLGTTRATGFWVDVPTIPTAEPPRLQLFLAARGAGTCWSWQGGGKMLFIFQNRSTYSANPEIPKPVKALSRPSWPWALLRFPGLNKKVLLVSKE